MKVAVMQPYIFPYIGYFQMIYAIDTFVFYDDVNFIKKGWIHRNNILINNKPYRFTIPCQGISQNKLINEVKLNFDEIEKQKFMKRIALAYKKAPYYDSFYPKLAFFLESDKSTTIASLAINSVLFICDFIGLKRNFAKSSISHGDSAGEEKESRLIKIALKENASIYVNAIGGKELYSHESFFNLGLELKFINSHILNYNQQNDNFFPNLSIIDVLMFNSIPEVKIMLSKYDLVD